MAVAAGVAAVANGTIVGLGAPTHVKNPAFNPKLPGSFTRKGRPPEGPAWYATPTVAHAVELGYDVAPVEAHVRYEKGRFLDGWYNRLRDAYAHPRQHAPQDAQARSRHRPVAGRDPVRLRRVRRRRT
jgi:hypothetical protein